jgi:hypothetical protein
MIGKRGLYFAYLQDTLMRHLRSTNVALRAIFIAVKMLEMSLGMAATLMCPYGFVAFITLKVRGSTTAPSSIIPAG